MRTGKVLLVMVAVLAMAGAASAQTPQTPMSCADLAQYGDVTVIDFENIATEPGGANAVLLVGNEFTGVTLTALEGELWVGQPINDGSENCGSFYGKDFFAVSPSSVFSPDNCFGNSAAPSPVGSVLINFDQPVLAVGLSFLDPEAGFSNIEAFDAADGSGTILGQAVAQGLPDNSQAFRYVYDSNGNILSAVVELGLAPPDGVGIDDLCYVTPAVPPCESDLIAGQYDNVGQVVVTDDCDGVKVKLTANEGFAFSEIHVGAGCVGDENIPVNKKGAPKIGQFYFSEEYSDVWLTEQEVTIPLDVALPCEDETDIDVAVHAVVKYLTPECQQPKVVSLHATANTHPEETDLTFPADIYRIRPTVPDEVYLTSQTEVVNQYTDNFNGNAFDGKYFYFSRFDRFGSPSFNPLPSDLFFNDFEGNSGFAGAIDGASGGTVHGGYYYYIKERTDDLYRMPLNGDGTVGVAELVNGEVLNDTLYGSTTVLAFGDIAIGSEDGKIFGSATRIPGGEKFFSANLDGTGYTELPYGGGSIGAGGIQIAFGADGVLYGVNARSPLQLIKIDPANGDVDVISTLNRSYSDLATGGYTDYCDVPDETAWGNGCFPDDGIQFSNDSGWAMYFKYFVNTVPGACTPE